jgi:hypothetical protein
MATRIVIIVGCLIWGFSDALDAADDASPLAPQPGVLVLRSGRVLRGEIVRVGDRYRVVLGGQDEVGVPADSVELQAATLAAAYHVRAQQLSPRSTAADHLALADWCVRYELWDEAAQELAAARALEPDGASAQALERRLRLAARPSPPDSGPGPAVAPPPPAPLDLEGYCRDLPPGTVEAFTNQIQPLLINRCGTSGCHGPRCESAFQLLYPSANRVLPRHTTQRNLYSVLRYVDRQHPETSPLLVQATTPHGNGARAAVSARDQNQLAKLVNWIQTAAGPRAAATQLPSSGPVLAPVAALRGVTTLQSTPAPTSRAAEPPPAAAGSGTATESPAPAERTASASGEDPFDPEIFNRRYLRTRK